MPEIGGVWYSDEAYAHMERLYQRLALAAPGTYREKVLTNEAAVMHAFHREFPGVQMFSCSGCSKGAMKPGCPVHDTRRREHGGDQEEAS